MTIKGYKLRECKLTFCGPPIFLPISHLINLQDDTRTADIQQSRCNMYPRGCNVQQLFASLFKLSFHNYDLLQTHRH
jgi:hypothetical protein